MSVEPTLEEVLAAKSSQATSLSLAGRDLTEIPKEIEDLSTIETLDLQRNRLREFPKQICKLTGLKTLFLGFNCLENIPPEIGGLLSLERLYLGYNCICDVPKELGRLKNLQKLHLNNNQIQCLPREMFQLPNLQELALAMNPIESPPLHVVNRGVEEARDWFAAKPQKRKVWRINKTPTDPSLQPVRRAAAAKLCTQETSREECSIKEERSLVLTPSRPTLDQLAVKYGTDKGSKIGERPGLDYCNQHYEKGFEAYRDQEVKLLEIGIKQGASLRMWHEYFSKALIYGIDLNPQSMITDEERIITFCGAQQDTGFLEAIVKEHGPFDFIIDDGGHWAEHQWKSLEYLSEHVRRTYFIEDLWKGYVHGGDTLFQALYPELSDIAYGESVNWKSVELTPHFVALHKG